MARRNWEDCDFDSKDSFVEDRSKQPGFIYDKSEGEKWRDFSRLQGEERYEVVVTSRQIKKGWKWFRKNILKRRT